jgi:hypothetical protein
VSDDEIPDFVPPPIGEARTSGRRCDHPGCDATITLPWQVRHGRRGVEYVYLCDVHAGGEAAGGRLLDRMTGRTMSEDDTIRRYQRVTEADPRLRGHVADKLPGVLLGTIEAAGEDGAKLSSLLRLRPHSTDRVRATLRQMVVDGEIVRRSGRYYTPEDAPEITRGLKRVTILVLEAIGAALYPMTVEETASQLAIGVAQARSCVLELVRRGHVVVSNGAIPRRYEVPAKGSRHVTRDGVRA